jgi:hypothetical protein
MTQYDPEAPEGTQSAVATETPAATPAVPKKTREEELTEMFPVGTQIVFVRTEFAGSRGEVTGTKTVGLGQTYIAAKVTHFKSGLPREGDRIKELLTLPGSIQVYVAPPEPEPAEEMAVAPTE